MVDYEHKHFEIIYATASSEQGRMLRHIVLFNKLKYLLTWIYFLTYFNIANVTR